MVFFLHDESCNLNAAVKPEHDACFLYLVPEDVTRKKLMKLNVDVKVVFDQQNHDFRHWIGVLVAGWHALKSRHDRAMLFFLVRASALPLLGPDKQQYSARKDAFDMIRLDSTKKGFEALVDVCNGLWNDEFCD